MPRQPPQGAERRRGQTRRRFRSEGRMDLRRRPLQGQEVFPQVPDEPDTKSPPKVRGFGRGRYTPHHIPGHGADDRPIRPMRDAIPVPAGLRTTSRPTVRRTPGACTLPLRTRRRGQGSRPRAGPVTAEVPEKDREKYQERHHEARFGRRARRDHRACCAVRRRGAEGADGATARGAPPRPTRRSRRMS
jgi:hypothetical protein